MPPTADGKVASRVGRPAKDEAHVRNITIQTLLESSSEELFYKIMAIKSNLEKKKQMQAVRATSVSQESYSREIFSNVEQGRGLFTALSQSQLVKTYRYSMHEELCMFWGCYRGWKGCTYETQSLPSRDLWVVTGSMIFSRKRVMRGHARDDSKAGF